MNPIIDDFDVKNMENIFNGIIIKMFFFLNKYLITLYMNCAFYSNLQYSKIETHAKLAINSV